MECKLAVRPTQNTMILISQTQPVGKQSPLYQELGSQKVLHSAAKQKAKDIKKKNSTSFGVPGQRVAIPVLQLHLS